MKLIDSPADIGIDAEVEDELRDSPGALREVHEDVLRDLMTTSHPIQRRVEPMGATSGSEAHVHPRRRQCV